MLVEDDNNLREIYGARLMAEGFDIVSAADGEEALSMAVKEKPDLIIADVMMPKISGFDVLDILRTTPETKDAKVIMMTALSQEEDRQRGESLGADKYLVKSQVTLEDVVNTVHQVLNSDQAPAAQQQAPPADNTQAQPAAPAQTAAEPTNQAPAAATQDTTPQATPVPTVAEPAAAPVTPQPEPTQAAPAAIPAPVVAEPTTPAATDSTPQAPATPPQTTPTPTTPDPAQEEPVAPVTEPPLPPEELTQQAPANPDEATTNNPLSDAQQDVNSVAVPEPASRSNRRIEPLTGPEHEAPDIAALVQKEAAEAEAAEIIQNNTPTASEPAPATTAPAPSGNEEPTQPQVIMPGSTPPQMAETTDEEKAVINNQINDFVNSDALTNTGEPAQPSQPVAPAPVEQPQPQEVPPQPPAEQPATDAQPHPDDIAL